ncbi:FAD-dependent oxidoreductase [Umezawaea sp. NPDC059074]|uniref:FAD-dependent oxidoreductase n=1 Tax=Umezawaea sp. NPDC059074 TaxID=3346716 RepID=UPI0036C3CDCE
MHHPILIVGAGLSGLVLARVLHLHDIDTTVLDLDDSPTTRSQGGMLDLHEDSGQAALRAAGLYNEFRANVHEGGQAMRILDQHAVTHVQGEDDGTGDRPEINRRTLRDLLLNSIPTNTIRWGSKVVSAASLTDGRHEVVLADGTTLTTDLLIGADGAWSKIRPLVSPAVPEYLGLSFVESALHNADARHPESAALIGPGFFFALGEDKGFLAHREPDGGLHVYGALKTDVDWVNRVDQATLADEFLSHFPDWDPALRALVADSDAPLIPRQIHGLPVGHRWDRVPGVTLMGDAAHLMSPFAGEGANLAMLDAADLAAALLAHPGDVEKALTVHEEAMFPRAEASAAQSVASLDLCFRADAPHGLIEAFKSFGA